MASSEYYRTLAQKCRQVAIRAGKRRARKSPYLLALAERFEEAAQVGDQASATDKPLGRTVDTRRLRVG